MLSGSEIERGIKKLTQLNVNDPEQGFDRRTTKEKFGWYLVDGVKRFRISSKHNPREVPRGRRLSIQKYLGLSTEEFEELCQCSMSGPEYHEKVLDMITRDLI